MTIVPDMLLLYVENVEKSAEFYTDLFEVKPVEATHGFAMFVLGSLRLGLWLRSAVKPAAKMTGGGGELGIAVGSSEEVGQLARDWKAKGVSIAQEPTDMDFGHTFVALDPDGHRIRVFQPVMRD
ncbi:MAG: VOC family protein [Mesorhizobium sp.]